MIRAINPNVSYHPAARICKLDGTGEAPPRLRGSVAVLTAGTADLAVAEEAAVTLGLIGCGNTRLIADIGVAGLQRLLARIDDIRTVGSRRRFNLG